jgi:hypothetical protein
MQDEEQPAGHPAAAVPRAQRLTFSYEGSNVHLLSRQTVEMIPPPSDPVQDSERQAGFWYTLRDREGRPIYRRVVHNPIRHDVEVFSDDPERSVSRVRVSEPRGVFSLLVPGLDEPYTLTLHSSPPGATGEAAQEIARFDIRRSRDSEQTMPLEDNRPC